jgi:triacylglycerol lipase
MGGVRAAALALVTITLGATGCGSEAGGDVGPIASTPAPAAGTDPAAPPSTSGTVAAPDAPAPSTAELGAPYPIVFLHGMGGFGRLELGPVGMTYFKGVAEALAADGEDAHFTLASPYDASEVRAQQLEAQINAIVAETGRAKVNLVGHSQGGLDARVLASPAGRALGARIASVTTIATPHRGSKVADLALGLIQGVPASVVDDVTSALLGTLQKSVYELQTETRLRAQLWQLSETEAVAFNARYVDDPRVAYMSYAGRTNLRTGIGPCDGGEIPNRPLDVDVAQPLLYATAVFLEQGRFIANDGLVTVASAKWGRFQGCVAADHMKEVGHVSAGDTPIGFDQIAFARSVVARIRAQGF